MHCVRTSGKALVAAVALALSLCACNAALAQGWVSPSSYLDVINRWSFEQRAFDGSLSLYAEDRSSAVGPGGLLEFYYPSPILCSRVAVNADWGPDVSSLAVEVREASTSTWSVVHNAMVQNAEWHEIAFSQRSINGIRLRYTYLRGSIYYWLYEIKAYEDAAVIAAPSARTETATGVESTRAALVGTCLSDGGALSDNYFQWGTTSAYGNTTPVQLAANGKGVTSGQLFTAAISGLAAGATYHYRAVVQNSAGVRYGSDRIFVARPPNGSWLSPTARANPTPKWETPELAFDGNTASTARLFHEIGAVQWGEPLILTRGDVGDPIDLCDKIRYWAKDDDNIDSVRVEYRPSSGATWILVSEGPFLNNAWVEKNLPGGSDYVQALRFTFHIAGTNFGQYWELGEVQLHSVTNRWTNGSGAVSAGGSTAGGDMLWSNPNNWSLGHVPVAGEAVVYDSSSQATCLAQANTIAQNLHSIVSTSAYTGQIRWSPEFAGGFSQTLNVTRDVNIQGGCLTVASKIINSIAAEAVVIRCANFTVGSGASVHSDERGFPAQTGPGAGDQFSFGGSHGGRGEDNVTNLPYGDPAAPITPGSGGSLSTSAAYDPGGQHGGGAIKIDCGAGKVRIDGILRANSSDDGFHNTGAGGSLWVVCGQFEGAASGLIQARGGNIGVAGRSPGGGGRVAVSYTGGSTYAGNFDVSGGADPQVRGQPGTLVLPPGANLTVRAPYKVGLPAGTATFGTVTVESGAELYCHSAYSSNTTFMGCQITAANLEIKAGGVVSGDEAGFAPLGGPAGSAAGAGHGGRGAGNLAAYGDAHFPITLGSGGKALSGDGSGSGSPHWGGGAIRLSVSGTLTVNGILRSNGGYQSGGPSGAGGSIWAECGTLSGAGQIQAKGGGDGNGKAGGGRIALYYAASSFSGSASAAGSGTGEAGSVLPGGLIVSAHAAGQAANAFTGTGTLYSAPLLRFALRPAGNTDDPAFENIQVSRIVFALSHVSGIVASDLGNLRLYADSNANGSADDEAGPVSASSVSATIDIPSGTGTISLSFPAGALLCDGTTPTRNYILRADVANLAAGDSLQAGLPAVAVSGNNPGIEATGADLGKPLVAGATGFSQLAGSVNNGTHALSSGVIASYQFDTGVAQTQGNGWQASLSARSATNALVDTLVEVTLSSSGNAIFYTDATYATPVTKATLDHGSTTLFVKDDVAQTVTLTATDSASKTGTSPQIVVQPTPVAAYTFVTATAVSAGASWPVTVRAVDGGGNLVASNNSVSLTSVLVATEAGHAQFFADAGLSLPIAQVTLSGGQAAFYAKDTVAESLRLRASDSAGKTGESADITVSASSVAAYRVTGTSPRIMGQGFSETVTALDLYGNAVGSAATTVNLTSSGAAVFYTSSSYSTPTTTATLSGGQASIYVKCNTAQTLFLTATDSNGKTGSSPSIAITLSIQQRIDLATPGDTLLIAPGEYHETFDVNKPLRITTANPSLASKPIIDGDGATYVCRISASDVVVEGLEFRDATSDLVHSEGAFLAVGQAHPDTFKRMTVRHCFFHDAGGEAVQLRNVVDATVESCLVWDVDLNGIFMDGVANAVVRHNEVKGAGQDQAGICVGDCFPATVEDNYIHDLYLCATALWFEDNWAGPHSIRNNVIANNRLRDMVSWHPYGGSALTVRKPTQNNTPATVSVEHNSVIGNTGQGPLGVTGHGIAWDWNGAPGLTMNIKNNLASGNSGYSFATRIDSVNYGYSPGGIFDFNDCTTGIKQPFADYAVGSNNIGAPPVFTNDPDAYGKYVFGLAACPAKGAGDDGLDMGAILSDPTGPLEEVLSIQVVLGASANGADDLVEVGAFLPSTVSVKSFNPWGTNPGSVRVYLSAVAIGNGRVELWDAAQSAQITYLDVALDPTGTGSAAFKVKGTVASSAGNDLSIQAVFTQGAASAVGSEDLTVLAAGTTSLVTTTFRVEDFAGNAIAQNAYVEVVGLGVVPSNGSLDIRTGTTISYRVLVDYGQAFGRLQAAGATLTGTVTATTNLFVGKAGKVRLQARDQRGVDVAGASVQVTDALGHRSGYLANGSELLVPLPGDYKALGRIGMLESTGAGITAVNVATEGGDLIAPFRTIEVVAKDQNGVQYTDVGFELGVAGNLVRGGSDFVRAFPVGAQFEASVERLGYWGLKQPVLVGPVDTQVSLALRSFAIKVVDASTQTAVPQAAWRLLEGGFESLFGPAGDSGLRLALPTGSKPMLEGFLWNCVSRFTPPIEATTTSVQTSINMAQLSPPVTITSSDETFSQAFYEGARDKTAENVALEISGGAAPVTVQASLLGNTQWYGYLPLSAGVPLTIKATATNKYGQTASTQVANRSWLTVWVGSDSDRVIPKGASVQLTTDSSGVVGAASIEIVPGDGGATQTIALGATATVAYNQSGAYTAQARILDAQGNLLQARQIGVLVIEVTTQAEPFACGLDYTRSVYWDVFPATARSQMSLAAADPTLLRVTGLANHASATTYPNRLVANFKPYKPSGPLGSGEDGGSASYAKLDNEQKKQLLLGSHPSYALRAGANGWIPASVRPEVSEFELYSSARTLTILAVQADHSYAGITNIVMLPKIDGVDISVTGMGGSGLGYNGSGTFSFKSADMDASGNYAVPTAKTKAGNMCHTVNAYQKLQPIDLSGLNNPPMAAALVDGGLYLTRELTDESNMVLEGGEERPNIDKDHFQKWQVWDGDDAGDVRSNPERARWDAFQGHHEANKEIVAPTYFDDLSLEQGLIVYKKFYDELRLNKNIPHRPLIGAVEITGWDDRAKNEIRSWWLKIKADPAKLHLPDIGDELVLRTSATANLETPWVRHGEKGWFPESAPLPGRTDEHGPVPMNFYHPRLQAYIPGVDGRPLRDLVAPDGIPTTEERESWDPGAQIRGWGEHGGELDVFCTNPGQENDFVDFGFLKGNRIGKASVIWHAQPNGESKQYGLRVEPGGPTARPGFVFEDSYTYSYPNPNYVLTFEDVIRVGRVEVDGWVKDPQTGESTLSTRDEFPSVYLNKKDETRPVEGNPDPLATQEWEVTIPEKATPVEVTFRAHPDEYVLMAAGTAKANGDYTDDIWVTFKSDTHFERKKDNPSEVWEVGPGGRKRALRLTAAKLAVANNPQWTVGKKLYVHVFKANEKAFDYKIVTWGQERYSKTEGGQVHHDQHVNRWWTNTQTGETRKEPLSVDLGPPWVPFLFRWAVTDQERFNVEMIDLDVDSDNDNLWADPERDADEDRIEDDQDKPGKIISVNNYDVDEDGVPDFADGFNADGIPGNADDACPGSEFVPLWVEVPDVSRISKLEFRYAESDPLLVAPVPDPDGHIVYPRPGAGKIRIWKTNAGVRDPWDVEVFGDFVPDSLPVTLEKLGIDANHKAVRLWVEGINPSASEGDVRVEVRAIPMNPQEAADERFKDAVRLTVLMIDADVDSDNNDGFNAPARSDYEDQIEDLTVDNNGSPLPGKYVPVNDNDDDSDGVVDYADFANINEQFVPLVLQVSDAVNLEKSRILVDYDASNPGGAGQGGPPPGALRLWTLPGFLIRNPAAAPGGDYVAPGAYKPADLGFANNARTVTLFIEGMARAEQGAAPKRIHFKLERTDLPGSIWSEDAVRVTVLGADLDIDSDNNNGKGPPDRSAAEELIEDQVGLPGKVVTVNSGDHDLDGVPGYADFADSAQVPGEDIRFAQLVLEIPAGLAAADIKGVKFFYPASDPNAIDVDADPQGNPIYILPPGDIRIWRRNGDQLRSPAPATGGGDFIPDATGLAGDGGLIPLANLGLDQASTVTLYVEGVQASTVVGQERIRMEVVPQDANVTLQTLEDAVRATVVEIDLDIDSDNTNGLAGPDENAYEDAIEDLEFDASGKRLPGKYVMANTGDKDGDGVPDFADGYNLASGIEDDINAQEAFVPVVLKISDTFDPATAVIRISYPASDPNAVVRTALPVQPGKPQGYTYTLPAEGHLRVWKVQGDQMRNPAPAIGGGGDYVAPGDYSLADLGLDAQYDRRVVLYVEGIKPSAALGDQRIVAEISDPTWGTDLQCLDAVRVTILGVDLDIDSDNDNGFEQPERDDAEDSIEFILSKPGKVLQVNDGDDDGDSIPDFADGYNKDEVAGNADDVVDGERFVPLIVQVPDGIKLEDAKLKFNYRGSNPLNVTIIGEGAYRQYFPATGILRIWTKDGNQPRNPRSVLLATPGNYVDPSSWIPVEKIGFGQSRTVTFYLEAVAFPNDDIGRTIEVEFSVNNDTSLVVKDLVVVSVLNFEVDEPRTPEEDFRPLTNAIVATLEPTILIRGLQMDAQTTLTLKEREVANGFNADVTSHASYNASLEGTVVELSGLGLDALPYTLAITQSEEILAQVDFLLYRNESEAGEKIVLHHPVGMLTENADDGTPLTFREGTLVVALADTGVVFEDLSASAFLGRRDLIPTGIIRNSGVVVTRPRFPGTSLLSQAATLSEMASGNVVGVCIDYYQGEEAITTEFLPQPLKDAYVRGDGSFGSMYQKQWHHFVTRSLPAVEFLKTLPGRNTSKATLGIVEAAYGEFALTHNQMSINPARLKAPWKFDVTVREPGAGPNDFTVNRIVSLNDGDLESLQINIPLPQREPFLSLPDVQGYPSIFFRKWVTSTDHGLGSLTYSASDGTKDHVYARDGSHNFVLGPAFDLKVRPLGMGGWTLTHVVAAFNKMADDPDVRVVNYSSSQWVIDNPEFQKAGVTIDAAAELTALRRAVNHLCGDQGKILVCSAGNYRRPIENRNPPTATHFLAPQVWGPTKTTDRSTLASTATSPNAKHLVVVGATELPSIRINYDAGVGKWHWDGENLGSVGMAETKAEFSNIGDQITLLAPGEAGAGVLMENGVPKFNLYNGTSAASPFIAGTLAQVLSIDATMSSLKAIEIVEATSDDLSLPVPVQGFGRVNVWKAVLTAANGHLSSQTGRPVGSVAPFSTVAAQDDGPDTKYYGLEIRTNGEEATAWLRTGEAGAFSYSSLGEAGQPLPVDFVPAPGQAQVHPALTYAGVPRLGSFQPEGPYIPWGKVALTAPKTSFAVCLTVSRSDLKPAGGVNPTLVVGAKGDDPRALGAAFTPVIEVPTANLQLMRNPGTAGGLIQQYVKSFDDFVFLLSE